jgi:hypothetical protein
MTTAQESLRLKLDEVNMIAYASDTVPVCSFHYQDRIDSDARVARAREIIHRVNVHDQLFMALQAAEEAIDLATDTMYFEDGQPVTALESWEIEQAYFSLCSVVVQIDEAVRSCLTGKEGSPT